MITYQDETQISEVNTPDEAFSKPLQEMLREAEVSNYLLIVTQAQTVLPLREISQSIC